MAFGAKYIFNFVSVNGKDTVVRISEDGFSGTALERCVGGHPTLRMESADSISGMSLEIPAECVVEDEFADLYTSDPYKFLVELLMGESVVWRGFITPELYSAPWLDPPYDVTLTATDGLGELKMRTFPALGRQSLEALLSTALGLTGLSLPIKLISSASTDAATAAALLSGTSVNLDHLAGKTYYEVVAGILASLHATIRQYNGAWVIIRETDVNNAINLSGDVEDLAGGTYPVIAFGSMRSNTVWPIGRMSMEIQPAKSEVRVTCPNKFPESLLVNPDMDQASYYGWTGGSQYEADGGFRAIGKNVSMFQDWMVPIPASKDYLDLTLKIRARSAGNAAQLAILIEATGTEQGSAQQTVYSLAGVYSQTPGQTALLGWDWKNQSGQVANTVTVAKAEAGDSSDCKEITVPVPLLKLVTDYLATLSKIRVTLRNVKGDMIYVHRAALEVTSKYDGVETALLLDNDARGEAPGVEPVMADTFAGNKGLPLIANAATGVVSGASVDVSTWGSDAINQLPYGEFLAKDIAFSVATPRLRLQGKLNTPVGIPSPFYKTKGLVFLTEQWSLDLLEDEADMSLLSLPASSIEVTALVQTAFNGEGVRSSLSANVTPVSFVIGANDTETTFYMAIDVPAGREWAVQNIPEWLTFVEDEGIGPDTVAFTASANSGAERTVVLIVAGVAVSVTQQGIGTDFPLVITHNPSDATLAVTVNGEAVPYVEGGILVASGSAVVVTITKTGYTTVTDPFTMPSAATEKAYTLTPAVDASVSYPATISNDAQEVAFHISDPSLHGWALNYSGLYYYMTAYRATGGYTWINGDACVGRGDAVVYLTFTANTRSDPRTIQPLYGSPFYFEDDTTQEVTNLSITQKGTSGVLVPVSSVSIPVEKSLALGASAQLSPVTVLPANADNPTLLWTSTDDSIVSVTQSGYITGRATGSATIRAAATDGSGHYADCYVTVSGETVHPTSVVLDQQSIVLAVGGTRTLHATVNPSSSTDRRVTWQSLNTSIATVNSSGLVTAVAVGRTTVRVTTVDGGHTADCEVIVTSSGAMSVSNVTVKSVATSGSAEISHQQMSTNITPGASPVAWISGITIDTTGERWYVRFNLLANTSSVDRTATLSISGTDLNGDSVGPVTFTVTQKARTSSDVPCSGMSISGLDTIANSGNEATYGVAYNPDGCTQTQCVWTLTKADGTSTSLATLTTNGNQATITLRNGANNLTLKLRATNYYNGQIYAEKTITANYMTPSAYISASPAAVTVNYNATSDNSPVVTTSHVQGGTLTVYQVSGFITSASVQNGRLVTVFSANSGSAERSGSVVLSVITEDSTTVYATVNYTQAGVPASSSSLEIQALSVQQVGGKVRARFEVSFTNSSVNQATFGNVGYSLTGKDSGGNVVFTKTGDLSDKTVAAMSTEGETYEVEWNGTVGMSVSYILTFYAANMEDTYTGDGMDVI